MNTEALRHDFHATLPLPSGKDPGMTDHDTQSDRAAIIAVIEGESAAFMAKDFDRWKQFWLQTQAARHWNWTPDTGITLLSGWDEISALAATAMSAFPVPRTDNVRRDYLEFTITPEMAWVVLDQFSADHCDPLESSGKKHEMWLLVKRDGNWLVACVSTLQPSAQLAACPVVQVDERCRVQWLNPRAQRRLIDHADLTISAGRLRARSTTALPPPALSSACRQPSNASPAC
jgi:hypothetical protein